MRAVIPLHQRPWDVGLVVFFALNLLFITYGVDVEQLVIADPNQFDYPLWPPPFWVDLVHWWGRNFDPVLMARPAWWRMTIWLDVLFFGPFYAAALYAFWRGHEWIRTPSIFYAGVLFANVTIILGEEMVGEHATPTPGLVLLVNLPWLFVPLLLTARLWRGGEHPFTRAVSTESGDGPSVR